MPTYTFTFYPINNWPADLKELGTGAYRHRILDVFVCVTILESLGDPLFEGRIGICHKRQDKDRLHQDHQNKSTSVIDFPKPRPRLGVVLVLRPSVKLRKIENPLA